MAVPSTAVKKAGLATTEDGALYVTIDPSSSPTFTGLTVTTLTVGSTTINETEAAFLDSASAANSGSGKAMITGASGALTVAGALSGAAASFTGEVDLSGNTSGTAGVGITGGTGTIFKNSVVKEGGIITTRILIDLTGLNGGDTAGDIIGTNGAGVAHLGQITAALNGTILCGRVTCMETPAGSNVDVDIWAADEATGVEDVAISTLTNEIQLINHGNWAAGQVDAIGAAVPAANQYLYLTSGTATDATFTAGKFLIELFGYDA